MFLAGRFRTIVHIIRSLRQVCCCMCTTHLNEIRADALLVRQKTTAFFDNDWLKFKCSKAGTSPSFARLAITSSSSTGCAGIPDLSRSTDPNDKSYRLSCSNWTEWKKGDK